jgi:phenylacetate-coenzyme A ligase PaaK-like adenylate-forming protein
MINPDSVFHISSKEEFHTKALEIFRFQAKNNPVYKKFLSYLKIDPQEINQIKDIPFLPIEFFKNHRVVSSPPPYDIHFKSSGTTGYNRSTHYIKSVDIYKKSFIKGFEYFFGKISDYHFLALLPSYLEQGESSLVYMTKELIRLSGKKESGFFLHNFDELAAEISRLEKQNKKTILLGVSYALLDFIEKHQFQLKNTIVMETGGMKGRKKEMLREELHGLLKMGLGVNNIYSEYGMTELLSQSYSKGKGLFLSPPWQKILIRDTEDPFHYLPEGKSGGINIIDLANIYSCSFIATQDLGKKHPNDYFEILGRFDHSDIRGCNLLIQ